MRTTATWRSSSCGKVTGSRRLLSEFLDFARVRATEFVPVDLQAVVTAAARMVREHPDCRPDIEIRVQGARTVLDGDEDLLHRVVANLMLNAVQAARGRRP